MGKKSNFFIFLAFLLPTTVFLSLSSGCKAESHDVIINELMWMGSKDNWRDEWIELKNIKTEPVDVGGWKITKGDEMSVIFEIPAGITINDYLIISEYDQSYSLLSIKPDLIVGKNDTDSTSFTISNDNLQVKLIDKDGDIIDIAGDGTKPLAGENSDTKKSMERNSIFSDGKQKENWHTCLLSKNIDDEINNCATPGEKNSGIANDKEEETYSGKLKINEIFPAPKTKNSGKEFVEIINFSNENITLSGMRIEDERSHKVFFPDKLLTPKEFFYLEGNFELNNTSPDTAFLIGKGGTKENPIDSVSYTDPEYDYAYAFDGTAWQWTSKITKREKNEFDKLLSGKIRKDKDIYPGVYADFEAKADSNARKFTWNFGDGHKSYLKKTRHKYEESGTYQASLKISGNGTSNILNFEVTVEDFGKSKVRIVGLSANPKGKDSKNEWVEILNDTKKKINIKGWSIATGWKKLYNHPIRKDFILKPGKTKRLTRDICAFTLANKQTKIELRYPDGKIADKLKYDHKDGLIREDELYAKNYKNWQWLDTENDTLEKADQLDTAQINSPPQKTTDETGNQNSSIEKLDIRISPEEIKDSLGKFSQNPDWQAKEENRIMLLSYNSNIKMPASLLKSQGKVLGKETERAQPEKLHWSKKIIVTLLRRLNLFINTFFLKLSL